MDPLDIVVMRMEKRMEKFEFNQERLMEKLSYLEALLGPQQCHQFLSPHAYHFPSYSSMPLQSYSQFQAPTPTPKTASFHSYM